MRLQDLLLLVEEAVQSKAAWIIGNHNLHSLYLYHRDPGMQAFYALAPYTFIDGMSLVLVGRLLGLPFGREHRLTGVDWLRPVLRHCSARSWRVFFLGSRPGVAARAAALLQAEIPGLEVETAHGYFDMTAGSTENEAVLAQIRAFRPQVLIVGMGMPRQEQWVAANVMRLDQCAVLNQGGIFDYVAGVVRTPPRLAGQLGLEWLFRFIEEPTRLWRRYLIEPLLLLPIFLNEYVRRSRAPLSSHLHKQDP